LGRLGYWQTIPYFYQNNFSFFRMLQEKVAKFARKEKEIYEKELYDVPVFAITYPDPTEP
jgi:hypothetical protein